MLILVPKIQQASQQYQHRLICGKNIGYLSIISDPIAISSALFLGRNPISQIRSLSQQSLISFASAQQLFLFHASKIKYYVTHNLLFIQIGANTWKDYQNIMHITLSIYNTIKCVAEAVIIKYTTAEKREGIYLEAKEVV